MERQLTLLGALQTHLVDDIVMFVLDYLPNPCMDNHRIRSAVKAMHADEHLHMFGPMSHWITTDVTDMSELFVSWCNNWTQSRPTAARPWWISDAGWPNWPSILRRKIKDLSL